MPYKSAFKSESTNQFILNSSMKIYTKNICKFRDLSIPCMEEWYQLTGL